MEFFFEIERCGNEAVCPNGLKRKTKVICKGFGGSMYLDSMNLPSLQKKKKKKSPKTGVWKIYGKKSVHATNLPLVFSVTYGL